MNVTIMGLGYIGLPTAAVMARKGARVHGVDINPRTVSALRSGTVPIQEPGLADLVRDAVRQGTLQVSAEPAPADAYLIVVPTPFKEQHEPDISHVEAATRAVLPLLKPGDLFVIESTSPIGTTEKMARLIARERPDLAEGTDTSAPAAGRELLPRLRLHVAYCPERVLPGRIIQELEQNDRVIGGMSPAAAERAAELYRRYVTGGAIHLTDARTAEMCKLTENASRDVQVAFANELSMICEKAGVDPWELIRLANRHPRVNILRPGCGVGGHCIAVDPWFLVSDYPLESRMIAAARNVNTHKAFWCGERIQAAIDTFVRTAGRPPVVALMGLAFKPDVDDLRESPALYIAGKISESNEQCTFLVVEPNVAEHPRFALHEAATAFARADIVVFLVAHSAFRGLPAPDGKVVLDFCGVTRG